jgi:hypothetical protein
MFRIYALTSGASVIYVGLTRRHPGRRLREHISRARGAARRSPVHDLIRDRLGSSGCVLGIRLPAETHDAREAGELERQFIRMYPEALNATPGGDMVSDAAAAAISDALRGRRKSTIARLRMSVSHRRAWSADGWRRQRTTPTPMIHVA